MTKRQLAAVAGRVLPGAHLLNAHRLTGGVSAHVHALEVEAGDGQRRTFVLRCHGATAWKAHGEQVTAREFALLDSLYRAGLPVPEPVLLDASCSVLTVPYLVTVFVDGTADVAPDHVGTVLTVMADTLAELHSLPTDTLPALPLQVDPLPELYDFLPPLSEHAALRAHLAGATDSAWTGPPVLLHGDFWPGNLLWRNGRLVAILDWEDAALGDPASDVAGCRLEILWRYGPDAVTAFTERYARHRPIDARRLALWEVFVGMASRHFMEHWGLSREREAQMRAQAADVVRAAAEQLLRGPRSTLGPRG